MTIISPLVSFIVIGFSTQPSGYSKEKISTRTIKLRQYLSMRSKYKRIPYSTRGAGIVNAFGAPEFTSGF
jgi:hypothetical protein